MTLRESELAWCWLQACNAVRLDVRRIRAILRTRQQRFPQEEGFSRCLELCNRVYHVLEEPRPTGADFLRAAIELGIIAREAGIDGDLNVVKGPLWDLHSRAPEPIRWLYATQAFLATWPVQMLAVPECVGLSLDQFDIDIAVPTADLATLLLARHALADRLNSSR